MSGIRDEIRTLLNRALKRATLTAEHSSGYQVARLGRINDLSRVRELLREADELLQSIELSAENRYAQAQTQTLRDEQQVSDVDSAKKLSDQQNLFDVRDVGTVYEYLRQVDPDTFADAFGMQEQERQRALFAKLRKAVNRLQGENGILDEPE